MSDRIPVAGETHLDRLDALIEAYEPGNYALADGVCHVYYLVPGSTSTLYADLVKVRRAIKTNAALVAAAPDLLAACRAAVDYCAYPSIREIVADAIAKAEGKS